MSTVFLAIQCDSLIDNALQCPMHPLAGDLNTGDAFCGFAVLYSVSEINNKADSHPARKAQPCIHRERHHLKERNKRAQRADNRRKRRLKRAVCARIGISQYKDAHANYDKSEKGAD